MTKHFSLADVFSLIPKSVVTIAALVGTVLSAYAGRQAFMGGSSVFMYFTIQSNLAVALMCMIGAVRLFLHSADTRIWEIIVLMGTVSITLTGIVFCFVLAPTMGNAAWSIQNVLTHVVVPIAAVLDFFVSGLRRTYRKSDALWVVIPPILYAIYAGIGYVNQWEFSPGIHYPYFFLNWGSKAGAFGFCDELPFMGCMWWIILFLVFLLIVGELYLCILNVLKNKK